MAPLPLFKIAALLFKEISKPLAAELKSAVKNHQRLRGATIWLGRHYEVLSHNVERLRNRQAVLGPISESHALTVGADLAAQAFLVSTGILLLLIEYFRGLNQKAAEDMEKLRKKLQHQATKEIRLRSLEHQITRTQARVVELEKLLADEQARAAELEAASRWRQWLHQSTAGHGPGPEAAAPSVQLAQQPPLR